MSDPYAAAGWILIAGCLALVIVAALVAWSVGSAIAGLAAAVLP